MSAESKFKSSIKSRFKRQKQSAMSDVRILGGILARGARVEDAEVVEEHEIAGLQIDVERGGFSREVQSVERKVLLLG
jgi:hypothetical protein